VSDRPEIPESELSAQLRAALAERAHHIEPSPDGLDRIEEKLMSERTSTTARRRVLGTLSAAAAVLVIVLAVAAVDGDGDGVDTAIIADTTTTTEPTTTTTSEAATTIESTTTTAFAPTVDPFAVAFPSPTTSRRFTSPEPAAQAYATEVLGFTDLQLGEFRAGDSRSGEIVVTDRPGGPETVIVLRQMEDDSWFVLGSVAQDITVDQPEAREAITSPFRTTGEALAFEGNVGVVVLAQDDPEPLGEGFVTGRGVPPAGSFEGEISYEPPTEDTPGVLVYRTRSAEDGHVLQATSFPMRLVGQ
jgi:hypothetical protein